jgi:hypothetical protein
MSTNIHYDKLSHHHHHHSHHQPTSAEHKRCLFIIKGRTYTVVWCLYFSMCVIKAVLWLRRFVAGLLPRRPGFDPGTVHVGFVVDSVALGQGFLRVLRFYPVNFMSPLLNYTEKRKKN